MPPRATMRLQLHKGFGFDDAARVAPYLARLGISHLYCSPILTARSGSMHGYDTIDPTHINPELGGEPAFRRMSAALRGTALGLIVDIVPNHMAVGSANPWWQDVLRHGQASRYASYFDIDWHPDNPLLDGKVLLPVLGRQYGDALAAGEITLHDDPDGWNAHYFAEAFPIAPADHGEIALHGPGAYIAATAEGRARLHRLLQRQNYRLAWWRTAGDEINWRRFFDINELIGLRTEVPHVFEATHALLFRLYYEGLIDGMRIDHVDGLTDPRGYCRRLYARLTELAPDRTPYVVVEKILAGNERLADDWCIAGTTGYDFMDAVNAVQHAAAAQPVLGALWSRLTGRSETFKPEEIAARREILETSFTAQLESTVTALHRVAIHDPTRRDTTRAALRRALTELIAHFPVYRSYAANGTDPVTDEPIFVTALDRACRTPGFADPSVIALIVQWLRHPHSPARRFAARKFQQLSAPIAAKAVEDTAFYRYGRLLSRNDVGFDAARLGMEPEEFYATCRARGQHFPNAMLATATHDHKRGEDVRARLAVLSEMPDEWGAILRRWMTMNAACRGACDTQPAPSPDDEIMLYQTLLGAWPVDLAPPDIDGLNNFIERIARWQEKALHEAKLRTSWTSPNQAYESACRQFIDAIMRSEFAADLARVSDRIGPAGAINGLAQVLLKLTVPGVPDFYQGTEFWDQSLVDPDNRRPVDFDWRMQTLTEQPAMSELTACWRDGRVKQAVIARALEVRQRHPELFARGDYISLQAVGAHAAHVLAFARALDDAAVIVVVPRLPYALLAGTDAILIPQSAWLDTVIRLPDSIEGPFHNAMTKSLPPPLAGKVAARGAAGEGPAPNRLLLSNLLAEFPVALLVRQPS